jgi:HK97 family phage portal protein
MIQAFKKMIGKVFNQSSGVANPEPWLVEALGGGNRGASGEMVTVERSLGIPAVWSSVNLIAGHMATMPLEIRRKTAVGSEVTTNHAAHKVLNETPNDLQTPFVLRQTLQAHSLMVGNGRAWIERNGLGQPVGLLLLPPESTYSVMVNGEKWHAVYFDSNYIPVPIPFGAIDRGLDGDTRSGLYNIPDRDVLHLPGFGWSGLWGTSLVQLAKDVFGNELAGIRSAGFMFQNNGHPSMLLQAPPGTLTTKKEADEFLHEFKRGHQGVDNTAKIGLLREGITAATFPISASDAQFIESRKFSRDEIALLLGTEYLMGQSSAVYKDLSERQAAYVVNTLSRWMFMWTEECKRKLLSPQERQSGNWEFRFDPRVLMRGSPNTLADYTGKLRQQGAASGNEVREIHGFNTVDDETLETYGNPNITTGEEAIKEPAEDTTEEPAEEPAEPQGKYDPLAYCFRTMIRHEQERIQKAAKKSEGFVKRCETFYKGYRERLADQCDDLGLPRDLAHSHCEESQRQILEVLGHVSPDALESTILKLTDKWPDRSEDFQCLISIP